MSDEKTTTYIFCTKYREGIDCAAHDHMTAFQQEKDWLKECRTAIDRKHPERSLSY